MMIIKEEMRTHTRERQRKGSIDCLPGITISPFVGKRESSLVATNMQPGLFRYEVARNIFM